MTCSLIAAHASTYDVLPLQPGCSHEQSMSGVFSIASHCVLQYLPDVVVQEQTGCAHFSPFLSAISLSPGFGSVAHDLKGHFKHCTKRYLFKTAHISIFVAAEARKLDFKTARLKKSSTDSQQRLSEMKQFPGQCSAIVLFGTWFDA